MLNYIKTSVCVHCLSISFNYVIILLFEEILIVKGLTVFVRKLTFARENLANSDPLNMFTLAGRNLAQMSPDFASCCISISQLRLIRFFVINLQSLPKSWVVLASWFRQCQWSMAYACLDHVSITTSTRYACTYFINDNSWFIFPLNFSSD